MEKITNKHTDNSTLLIGVLCQYLRYWKWFIVSFTLSLIVALGLIITITKQYKPSLSILINEDNLSKNQNNKTSGYIDLETLGFLNTTNNIENEIIILSSPNLMTEVVKSLSLNICYFEKKLSRDVDIYKRTPFKVSIVQNPDMFDGICDFYIQKTGQKYTIKGSYLFEGVKTNIDLIIDQFPHELALNDKTLLNINFTETPFTEGNKYYVKIRSIESASYRLSSKLSVTSASAKSSVLNIAILIDNSTKGIDILNNLIFQYNKENTRLNNQIAYNTSLFINDRLKEISTELRNAETDVVEYKQEHNIADLGIEAEVFINQTDKNEQNLMEAETQLGILKYIQDFIKNPLNKTKIIPNIGISDNGLSLIIQEYNNKLLASDQLLKGTGEKNPARQRVVDDLSNMVKEISGSLANVRNTYVMSKNELLQRSYKTQSQIRSVPKQERGLLEKEREQKIKENLFLFLMQKREETNLSIAATSEKARIVTSSQTNLAPVSPNRKLILLALGILGILIPIVIIYLRNLFRTNITSKDDFEHFSTIPIIGEIAVNKSNSFIVIDKQQNVITETFRSLRNSIKFASIKKSGLTILITSTIANEGKTFISSNLALSFAQTDKKVLLISGNIRDHKIPEILDQDTNKKGLSDYLATENCSWEELLITPYKELENLQILPSGTIMSNPNELLLNVKLEQLIKAAQAQYDYIIIDSAPLGLISDSYLIGEYADLTLYIIRENKTPKTAIDFINIQQKDNKLKNIYVVLNGIEISNGYGKKYGYKTK